MSDDQPGGINVDAGGDATIGGDAVGRDKITSIATHYYGPLPTQPRRAELPHQPYFFGREEELARITDALDPESAGWGVLIDGPGGIGKTALADFLNFSGRWDERLTLNLRAEERAVTSNDTQSAGRRAYQAGLVHFLRGQASEVLACARRMEKHWVNARAREKAVAIHLRGLGHRLEKDYPAAIAAFQEMLALDRTSKPDSGDVSVGLTDLAAVEQLSGDYEAAERDYREALRISRKINDREGVAFITGCLADIALDRRDWPAAEALAREALPLVDALGRQDIIAEVSQTLAIALFRQGRLADGFPHAQRAVEIFTKLRSPELEKAQAVLKECEGVNG